MLQLKEVIIESLNTSLSLIIVTMGMGYLIGIINKMYNYNMKKVFGGGKHNIGTLIGVTIHELSHYIMCKIFGHKVIDMKILNFDGTNNLGYVRHTYNKKSVRQRIGTYFIPQGPLIIGGLIIALIIYLLIPELLENHNRVFSVIFKNTGYNYIKRIVLIVTSNLKIIFNIENLKKFKFYLFLLLAVTISTHSDMSKEDVKNCIKGTPYMIIFIFTITFITKIVTKFDINKMIIKYNTLIMTLMVLIMTISIIALIMSILLRVIKNILSNIN